MTPSDELIEQWLGELPALPCRVVASHVKRLEEKRVFRPIMNRIEWIIERGVWSGRDSIKTMKMMKGQSSTALGPTINDASTNTM